MLKLLTIDESRLEAAAGLLLEGFPHRSLGFWREGLRRIADHNKTMGEPSPGTFLMAGDEPVGILLAIPRLDSRTGRKIVNLSSWYVRESHRWSAARLIMAALGDKSATYTDLTPTRAAAEVNARFGFRSIGFNLLLVVLPWLALAGRGRGRLVPLAEVPPGALSDALVRDLKAHQDLGCIVTTVEQAGRYFPVVFDVVRKKRLLAARVVYADSMDIVANNLAGLARLLIRHGALLLTLHADENAQIPYAWVWKRGLVYQVRGEWDDRTIDDLYSERVLLKV